MVNKPFNGGEAWVRLSWIRGLQRLGFDVFFLEEIDPATCVGPDGGPSDFEGSVNRAYFDAVVDRFGLAGRAAVVHGGEKGVHGVDWSELLDRCAEAAFLVNIRGHLSRSELLDRLHPRAYVDLDPGYTQFWHAAGHLGDSLHRHDVHFTVGENVGTDRSPVPPGDLRWHPVRPPVVLDDWPTRGARESEPAGRLRFTTVGSWRGAFGSVEWNGRVFGLKAHEFRKVGHIPSRVEHDFEAALDIHAADRADREALEAAGWSLVDPREHSGDADRFRSFVVGSDAEFSVAQGIYVETCSGWFSDRSVRYLAAGKPVLVQETGFSEHLPTGEGLLGFRSPDEAAEGARAIGTDYECHSHRARELATEFFDSDRILTRFVEIVDGHA
jgi:hypothetical protein